MGPRGGEAMNAFFLIKGFLPTWMPIKSYRFHSELRMAINKVKVAAPTKKMCM